MRPRGVLPIIGLLLVASTVGWAIDLRDMPPWMRDMIQPVYIDWQQVAEQASLDPAGVHIWAPQQSGPAPAGVRVAAPGGTPVTAAVGSASPVVGAITPPRVTLSGSGGADAPGGTAVRAPGAVALPGHGSVHVQGLGSELVGGSPVTVGGAGALSLPQSVSLSQTADEWDATLASIEGMDEKSLAEAGQIITMVREQALTQEEFVRWVHEHGASLAAITGAYRLLTRNKPYWNEEARIVCAALSDAAGPNLEHLEDIPVEGRPGLATYVGLGGREDDVKAVLQSMSASSLDRLQPNPYYLVAGTLLASERCLRVAVWAWKTEAERRGPIEQAHVCLELRLACSKLRQPQAAREELIPWAEAALARSGSEREWHRALPALLWAYESTGDDAGAIRVGRHWLSVASERGVDPARLAYARVLLATVLERTGDTQEAISVLRDAATSGHGMPRVRAQCAMLRLLGPNPGADSQEEMALPPPQLDSISPTCVRVCARGGRAATARVEVAGSPTLEVEAVDCELPAASAVVASSEFRASGRVWIVRLTVHAEIGQGQHRGRLVVHTNDPDARELQVPLVVSVSPMLLVTPRALFFGYMDENTQATSSVAISAPEPFRVLSVDCDRDIDLTTTAVCSADERTWTLTAVVRAPEKAGLFDGTIEATTDAQTERVVQIPYHGHVKTQKGEDERVKSPLMPLAGPASERR